MQTKVSFANSGLREYCTKYLKRMRPHVSSVVIVYDSAVPEYLLGQATAGVIDSGCNMKLIKASRGVKNKTIENAVQLATKLLKAKVDRNSLVLAVGGGGITVCLGPKELRHDLTVPLLRRHES